MGGILSRLKFYEPETEYPKEKSVIKSCVFFGIPRAMLVDMEGCGQQTAVPIPLLFYSLTTLVWTRVSRAMFLRRKLGDCVAPLLVTIFLRIH